jgi:hypothetical protein
MGSKGSSSAAAQARENRQASGSAAKKDPPATEACWSGLIEIGLFFDGTGNNSDDPKEFEKTVANPEESNVAKLHFLFSNHSVKVDKWRKQACYYSGVGSNSKHDSGIPNAFGIAGGAGGQRRINLAFKHCVEFFNRTPKARKLMYVYGFSRGAALARHFVNEVHTLGILNTTKWVSRKAYRNHGKLEYKYFYNRHTFVEVNFLGVFDTVGSFGIAGNNWDEGYNFHVDFKYVGQVRHFLAEDEHRKTFPLQSIKSGPGASLPGNAREWSYPGAHSDVGGGYAPGEEGKPRDISNITLRDMYNESVRAGVPMMAYPGGSRFEVSPELNRLYSQYHADRQNKLGLPHTQYIHGTSEVWTAKWPQRQEMPSYLALRQKYLHIKTSLFREDVQRNVYYQG